MNLILVINSGSSTLKYQLIDTESSNSLLQGSVDRVTDHQIAFEQMLENLHKSGLKPDAIAHRVVHGGDKFSVPVLITEEVEATIEDLVPLAPLHNPGNLAGIRAGKNAFPNLRQVAVFDTAFHQSMPEESYKYAIDQDLSAKYGIRKYGFHGSSYSYVSRKAAEYLGIPLASFNAVILHLGNGASVCAIRDGKSFDTSMGLTPLPGLVMGSRSGDIDPAIVFYLSRQANMSIDQIDELLNKKSGLLAVAGESDFRDISVRAKEGDSKARLAIKLFTERIRHYLGAYALRLGRLDAVIFTGGIGENNAETRDAVCANLQLIGIEINSELNRQSSASIRKISSGLVPVLVVPTNEELEIANQAAALLGDKNV